MKPLVKDADRCRQVLSEQQITSEGPGTILRDIEVIFAFIGPDGLKTTSKQGNLPAAALPELNARLTHSLKLNLQRPLLRDYPNIAGLYVLLRVMDMVRADARRLWINPEARRFWQELNSAEKYFALLEAWLFCADAEVLGGGDHRYTFQLEDKERNVLALFDPLGVTAAAFGATLLPNLDTLGALRGTHAHASAKAVRSVLDPETEYRQVCTVVTELEYLDAWLSSYRRRIR